MNMWRGTMLLVGFLTVFGCFVQPSDSYRILALFPLNSNSHYAMCDRLARGLAARGHQIDVYSHYPPKKPIANYRHFSLEGTLEPLTNNMNYSTALKHGGTDPREIIRAVGNPCCKLMELPIFQPLFNNPPKDPPYDLVIVETFVADCYLAWGRRLGVPMVGVMANMLTEWYSEAMDNPINTALTPSLASNIVLDISAPMNFWQRLMNTLLTNIGRSIFELAIYEQNEITKRLFGRDCPGFLQLRRDLDLIIVNSHHSLQGTRPLTPSILSSAGMHIDDEDESKLPEDIEKWLDDSKQGCVYVSFGSMVKLESFPWSVLQAFYRTFENIAPVRVLLKIANPAELPAALPDNVMVKSWFPQLRVLKHKNTKAFITHGGLLSAEEAIHSAVPMVGIPIFGDQPYNARMNVNRGIGTLIELGKINEEKLTAAVREILNNPSYKQAINKLSREFTDRPMKPLDEAVYWVEYVARHGKKCLRSSTTDIQWWQANLLDVYAFIITFTIFVAVVMRKISMKYKKKPIVSSPKSTEDKACGLEEPIVSSPKSTEDKACGSEEPIVSSATSGFKKKSKKKNKHSNASK